MGKKKGSKNRKVNRSGSDKILSLGQREMVALKVEEIAVQLCNDEGLELVHVEFVVESYMNFLRVYIDKPGGVSMTDCSDISRQLGDIIDVSVSVDAEYRLEVSSPGIFRKLYKKADYIKFCGKAVKIQTNVPIDGKMKFKGILKEVPDDDSVTIMVDGDLIKLDYSSIKNARLTEDNGDSRC